MPLMPRFIETIGGLWQLFRLALREGLGLRGPYWRWRQETAFGVDRQRWPSFRSRLGAVLDYGRWLHRMKRRR